MKTLYKVLISLVLLTLAVPMVAQTNLERWVKKCEGIESVDITVIRRKNPKTGKVMKDMVTLSFRDNDALYKELLDACRKDEEAAYDVIKERKNGEDVPQIYRFRNGEIDIQYIFSKSKNNNVGVTIIKRDSKNMLDLDLSSVFQQKE